MSNLDQQSLTWLEAYSAVPSLLDYSTGTMPVAAVDSEVDYEVRDYQPLNIRDQENWLLCEFATSHS